MFVYQEGGHLQRGVIDELLEKSAMGNHLCLLEKMAPQTTHSDFHQIPKHQLVKVQSTTAIFIKRDSEKRTKQNIYLDCNKKKKQIARKGNEAMNPGTKLKKKKIRLGKL